MIRVSGIQMTSGKSRKDNLSKALTFLHRAVEDKAQIVCFPELFSLPWFPAEFRENVFQWAETIDGPTVSTLREEAQNHQLVIIAPFFERDRSRYYNSAAVIDSDGGVAGIYRKVHLPQLPFWEEKKYFSPGNLEFPVFTTRYGKIGVQICWDNFFPEGARILAVNGAEIIFAPTASAMGYLTKWDRVLSANAIVNTVYIFRVNRVGHQGGLDFYGRTFCVDPHGDAILHPVEMEEGIYTVDLDLENLSAVRKEWAFLANRQTESYRSLCPPLPQKT